MAKKSTIVAPDSILPKELWAFRKFLYLVWQSQQLPDPTPMQYVLSKYLQHGTSRRMVQAQRGLGKSWITVAYAVWFLAMWPSKRVLITSASGDGATQNSTFALQLIMTMDILEPLRPRTDQRQSTLAFDVGPALPDKQPSLKSIGINGQMAGNRADLLISDDVESLNNSYTDAMRMKLHLARSETFRLARAHDNLSLSAVRADCKWPRAPQTNCTLTVPPLPFEKEKNDPYRSSLSALAAWHCARAICNHFEPVVRLD